MNWKTWALLAVALALGFGAAYGVKAIFFDERGGSEVSDDANSSGARERALVANGDIPAGMELTAQNVRFVLMAEQDVPRDAIVSFNGVSGRVITRDLKDGEPVSLYDLEEPCGGSATSIFVPPGYAVVPIEICSVSKETGSLNYLKTTKLDKIVKPGDVVDVSVAKEDRRGGSTGLHRLVTETIASDVAVFSVTDEKRFGSDGSERYSSLSALLTSEQVELIRKAYGEGKLKLTLRNGVEEEPPMELFPSSDSSAFVPARNNDGRVWQTPRSSVVPTVNENFVIGAAPEPEVAIGSSTDAASGSESEPDLVEPESVIAINPSFLLGGDASSQSAPETTPSDDQIVIDASSYAEEGEAAPLDDARNSVRSAPQWSRVSFDDSEIPALEPANGAASPALEGAWTSERAFRERASETPAQVDANADRYNLATSQTQIADSTVAEDEELETSQSNSQPATSNSGADADSTSAPKVNAVKKVSPFITTPAKTNRRSR